jgi:hypothetical protein
MKTISIKQPWASLIIEGIKDIENRTWKTSFRGTILIHATAKSAGTPSELLNNEQLDYFNINPQSDFFIHELMAGRYTNSAILGTIDIVDCVVNHPSIWAQKGFAYASYDGTQYQEIYNWVLSNPVKFDKPILNVKGKLSLWDYPINEK